MGMDSTNSAIQTDFSSAQKIMEVPLKRNQNTIKSGASGDARDVQVKGEGAEHNSGLMLEGIVRRVAKVR